MFLKIIIWIKSINTTATQTVKRLHRFLSVHVSVADRMSHYRECPPGGAMIQSNVMRAFQIKRQTEKKWGHCKAFHNRRHKIEKRRICINRHIIKYYVITEHVLFHGLIWDWFWRERRLLWSKHFSDLLTSYSVSLLTLPSMVSGSPSYLHGPSNYQTAVSTETIEPKIWSRYRGVGSGGGESQGQMAGREVFTPFVSSV